MMLSYIDLEVNYKRKLLKLLESIDKITIKDNDRQKVVYIKKN